MQGTSKQENKSRIDMFVCIKLTRVTFPEDIFDLCEDIFDIESPESLILAKTAHLSLVLANKYQIKIKDIIGNLFPELLQIFKEIKIIKFKTPQVIVSIPETIVYPTLKKYFTFQDAGIKRRVPIPILQRSSKFKFLMEHFDTSISGNDTFNVSIRALLPKHIFAYLTHTSMPNLSLKGMMKQVKKKRISREKLEYISKVADFFEDKECEKIIQQVMDHQAMCKHLIKLEKMIGGITITDNYICSTTKFKKKVKLFTIQKGIIKWERSHWNELDLHAVLIMDGMYRHYNPRQK